MTLIPPSSGTGYCGQYGPASLTAVNAGSLTPLASTTVTVYESDGSTAATLFTNRGPSRTSTGSNTLTTNLQAMFSFFADPGLYVLSFLVAGTTTTLTVEVLPDYTDSAWNVVPDTAGGTITPLSGDSRVCDATTANTVYSGLIGNQGARYRFARKDATSNTCTINAPSGGNIVGPGLGSGVSAITLPMQGETVELQGDGTNLRVVKWGPEFYSGSIPTNVALGVNTATKIFDTVSLGVGAWLVTMVASGGAASASNFECFAAADTATATLSGVTSGGVVIVGSGDESNVVLSFVATVTVAGTLKMVGEGSAAGGTDALASSANFSFSNVTGYTATRLGS